jgi:hypothetical protein
LNREEKKKRIQEGGKIKMCPAEAKEKRRDRSTKKEKLKKNKAKRHKRQQ